MTAASAFLSDAEVERLTGYRMFKRQCAQLKRWTIQEVS